MADSEKVPSTPLASTSRPSEDTPFGRLAAAFRFATQRVDSTDEVPEIPPAVREWGQNTSLAMFAGICFMGARQYSRHARLGPYRPQQPGLSSAQEARLIAEENTRRLVRLSTEAIKGGLKVGALAGLFYGVQGLSAIARDQSSLSDTVLAATVTGGVFGSFLPGGALLRLRSAILGAALGASAGFPVGFLQEQLSARLRDEGGLTDKPGATDRPETPKRRFPALSHDSADAVIKELEAGLRRDN